MKVFLRWLCMAGAAVLMFAPAPLRAQANFSGVWTLNVAASDLGDVPPPKSDVLTMTQTASSFAWSEVFTMSDGSTMTESWSGKMDGVVRPVAGPGNSQASYKADGTGRWISPEGNSDLLATVSADGKQFVLVSTTKLPHGKLMKQKFVYDRAK